MQQTNGAHNQKQEKSGNKTGMDYDRISARLILVQHNSHYYTTDKHNYTQEAAYNLALLHRNDFTKNYMVSGKGGG